MIISITGATGFVGKRLAQACIEAGHNVRVLSRKEPEFSSLSGSVEWFRGDLNDIKQLNGFVKNSDILYHCAGEIRDSTRMMETNHNGTCNLITPAQGSIGRWVQLSSVGVYGASLLGTVCEETLEKPSGVYEESKALADNAVKAAARDGAFEAVFLRPSIVYGLGMPNLSVFQLIEMINRGLFFFVGPKGAVANYVHVDDVVAALILCGNSTKAANKVYNLSADETIETLVYAISEHLKREAPSLRLPRRLIRGVASVMEWIPGMPLTVSRVDALSSQTRYSIDRIKHDLGFSPKISLQEGMAQLVRFWKSPS